MADEITPALTPSQWAARSNDCAVIHDGALRLPGIGEWPDEAAPLDATDALGVMALANAALPDDHPNKLAWADVEVVTRILPQWMAAARGESVTIDLATSPQDVLERLSALAAKLSALLPPEDAR
jgi:hypothetical protein